MAGFSEGSLSYSTLLERLSKSLSMSYVDDVIKYWNDILAHPKKGVAFPTMKKFFYTHKKYRDDLIKLYREKMVEAGVKTLKADLNTMASQGALLDGLCFVYDSVKNVYSLVTMNFDLLYGSGVEFDLVKQVKSKNEKGIVKAYRIDVVYDNSEDSFSFKVVNARDFDIDDSKPDMSDDKRFFLVPYVYVLILMKFLQKKLKNGEVLKVTQLLEGSRKVRLITENKEVLGSMCDVPEAVQGVYSRYFPLNGFFYAPLIGAPSTSAMVTNINLFDIDSIYTVPSDKLKSQYDICSVRKPANPVSDMLAESMVVNKLMYRKDVDLGYFASSLEVLPYRSKLLAADVESISRQDISHYLHSLSSRQREFVYKTLDIKDEVERRKGYISKSAVLSAEDLLDLRDTLKKGICRLVIQKSDCKLSSILCSNSESVLAGVYGKDYIRNYESFSYRFSTFYSWLTRNQSASATRVLSAINAFGLPNKQEDVDFVVATIGNMGGVNKNTRSRLEGYFSSKVGINLKMSNSQSVVNRDAHSTPDSSILVRTLTAYIDENGKPVNYYRKVDISKIVSGVIFY